ncbi:MAG: histidinol-phosphatase HisJ family protein [Clostridiales bacterium]|jgi:histidinol-phosphatase (PHP family)|nr:histidinol-phosphatase HisJ family protein [Clostridiales bacterium]
MLFDAHVHSILSLDSEMDPAEAIEVLSRKGFGCCFTDHVDFVTPTREGCDLTANDIPRAEHDYILPDIHDYPGRFARYKSENVALGLEIGLTAAFRRANEKIALKDGLDFIIGSVHFVDGWDLYNGDFYQNTPGDPYRRMLEYTREMIALNGFFDALGHIDYISRYSPLPEKNVLYERYPEEYDAVFNALIERDKVLELNTKRLNDPAAAANMFRVLRRYRELGGRHVTFGSDAHRAEDLARNFDAARRLAGEAGLAPVCYKGRKKEAAC